MDREHPASPSRYGAHVHLSQSVQEKRRGPQRKPGSSPHGSASRSANYPSPAAQMRFLGPHEGRGGQRHDRSTPSGKMLGPEPHHRKPHAHHAAHSSVPHAQRCQNTTPTLLSQALKRRIHSSLRVLCFEFFFENSRFIERDHRPKSENSTVNLDRGWTLDSTCALSYMALSTFPCPCVIVIVIGTPNRLF